VLPIDPEEIQDVAHLQGLLKQGGLTKEYYAQVQERIDYIAAEKTRVFQAFEAAKEKVKVVEKKPKKKGELDGRSFKHGVTNGAVVGAVPSAIGAFATYRQLKAEGLAPSPETVWDVFSRLPPMIQAVVAFGVGIGIVVMVLTLANRYNKEY